MTEARPRRAAFTLVEIMVSLAVLCILVVLLVEAFNAASRAWISGEAGTERRTASRAVMDSMATELQSALLPVESKAVAATGSDLQLVIDPGGDIQPYQNGDAIFWQAPVATESSYGDVAEVGYFVRWDVSNPRTPVPQLCRFFVNPSIQDSKGNVTANPNFLIYSPSDPNAWLNAAILAKTAPADRNSGYAGLFAENVLGFWAHAYGLDGSDLKGNFDSRKGYTNHFATWSETRYLPSHIRISFAQLDGPHAGLLAPVWSQVQTLTRGVNDASAFQTQLEAAADGIPGLRAIVPWVRIYSTDVYLENGR